MADAVEPNDPDSDVKQYLERVIPFHFSGKNPKIFDKKALSEGHVYIIHYDTDTKTDLKVYLWRGANKTFHRFSQGEDLIGYLSDLEQKRYALLGKVFQTDVIAGIIAFSFIPIIFVTVLTKGPEHIDPILSSCLSLILGFYFGREAKKPS